MLIIQQFSLPLQGFGVKPTALMGGCMINKPLKSSSERRWSLLESNQLH